MVAVIFQVNYVHIDVHLTKKKLKIQCEQCHETEMCLEVRRGLRNNILLLVIMYE